MPIACVRILRSHALIGLLPGLIDLDEVSVFGLATEPPKPAMLFHLRPPTSCDARRYFLAHPKTARLPAPSPSGVPATAAANELDDQEEYQCADSGVDDGRDDAGAEVNAQPGQHPAANERTNNS